MQQLVAASLKQQQIQSPPLKLALFGGQLISREYKENFQKLFQVAIPYVSMRYLSPLCPVRIADCCQRPSSIRLLHLTLF